MHQKFHKNRLPSSDRPRRWVSFLCCKDRGFTLLEILIAIFIFAIIVTTIFVSTSALLSGNETTDQGTAVYEMAKSCLDRMMVDLESIHLSLAPGYSAPGLGDPPELYRIVGEMFDVQGVEFPRLRFTSLAHVSFGEKRQKGIAEIVYYVQATDAGHYVLKRADNLYPYPEFEEKAKDPILCMDLKSLVFKYYDQEGTAYDLWDSDNDDFSFSTPRAIGIKIELARGPGSQSFETMVTLPVYREEKQ